MATHQAKVPVLTPEESLQYLVWPRLESLPQGVGIRFSMRNPSGCKVRGVTTRVIRSMIYWNLMYGFQTVLVLGASQTRTEIDREIRRQTPIVRSLYPEVNGANPSVDRNRHRIFTCYGEDLLERSVHGVKSTSVVEDRAIQVCWLLEAMACISIETASQRGPEEFVHKTTSFGPDAPTLVYLDPSLVTTIFNMIRGRRNRYSSEDDLHSGTSWFRPGWVSDSTMIRLSEAISSARSAFSPGSTESLPDLGVWV